MANPFYVEPVNPLAALMSGQQGYEQGQKRMASNAIEGAAPYLAAGDYKNALAQIMSGGGQNLQAALAVQGLANNDRDYKLHERTAESTIAHQRAQDKQLENPDLHFETVTPNPLDPSSTRIIGFNKKTGQPAGSFPITGDQPPPQSTQPAPQAAPQAAFSPANPTPNARVAQGFQDTGVQPAAGAKPSPYNESVLANLPPSVQTQIKALANYDLDPSKFSVRAGKNGSSPHQMATGLVKQYYPPWQEEYFSDRRKTEGAFGSGPEGRVGRAIGNLTEHLGTAEEVVNNLHNGVTQWDTALKRKFFQLFGSLPEANAAAIAPIIGGEMAKVIAGATAGSMTERIENALNTLGASKTTEQLVSNFKVVKQLMVGQIHGLENQFVGGTHYHDPEVGKAKYRERLAPGVRQILDAEEARNKAPPGGKGQGGGSNADPFGIR